MEIGDRAEQGRGGEGRENNRIGEGHGREKGWGRNIEDGGERGDTEGRAGRIYGTVYGLG